MEDFSVTSWVRLSEIRKYYLHSLNNSDNFMALFGKEFHDKYYSQQYPSLKGFIIYFRNFKLDGFNVAIIGKKNKTIKISYGKQ